MIYTKVKLLTESDIQFILDNYVHGNMTLKKCAEHLNTTRRHIRKALRKANKLDIIKQVYTKPRKNYKGYVKIYVKELGIRVREHIYVAEQILSRKLFYYEVVHHVNQNKEDNNPINLLVLSRSSHSTLHKLLVKEMNRNTRESQIALLKQNDLWYNEEFKNATDCKE